MVRHGSILWQRVTCGSWSEVSYFQGSSDLWVMKWSVIFSDNETRWPKLWPQNKYSSTLTYISWFSDFAQYLQDYLMDEHHSWYDGSVWHKDWPHQVYVGQWPLFYGPQILLHILKTVWWRNVVLGIMDQCDNKDRPRKIYVGQWPILLGPLILHFIIVIDLNYFYT